MKRHRIGLIGLGGMAREHIRWMDTEGRFELVAISDVNAEAREKAGEQFGVPPDKRYSDFERLIADADVEAIVAVTPNDSHAAIVRACLEAGKPFLAEKPFTRIFEEAEALLELHTGKPTKGMIGFSYRYTAAFRYARKLIREGKIGPVRSFSIQYLQSWGGVQNDTPFLWRFDKRVTGTGTLGDLGSHMIDMARFLFGEFEELSAQLHTIVPERRDPATGRMAKVEVDDFASFQARMAGDVFGVFQTSRNAFGSGNQHEASVYGDFGTLHASTLNPDQLVWIRQDEASGEIARTTLDVPQRCKTTQYADFAAMLDGEERDGLPGVLDGYRNQQVLDAVVRAHEGKRTIRI